MANLRDPGGITIAAGVIQPGRLLRSAAPAHFGAAARARIERIGPVAVADLRATAEQRAFPTCFLEQAKRIAPPGASDHAAGDPAAFADACTRSESETRAAIGRIYAAIPVVHAAGFGALYTAVADGRLPLLVHCAVGKDRTGAAVAILLDALGATRAAITADYLASNAHRAAIAAAFASDPRTAGIRAAPEQVWAPLLRADLDYLDSLFAALGHLGGAKAYVARAVGEGGLARIGRHLTQG